jgi:1-acyl-sn-glycerol-3-phosphate acyltransferase
VFVAFFVFYLFCGVIFLVVLQKNEYNAEYLLFFVFLFFVIKNGSPIFFDLSMIKIIGKVFYFLYQWLVFLPIILVATFLTALFTIILSYVTGDSKTTYLPAIWWSRFICGLAFVKVEIQGEENFKPNESYVFLANHQSVFDIFLVYGWLNSRFKWIMKKEIRKMPFVGAACEAAGHVFIDRSHPMAAKKSIELAKKRIIDGNSIVIFPEGTRTNNGKVGNFKRGAFLIATDFELPIVPITIIGAFERMSRHTLNIKPGKIIMKIHPPIVNTACATDDETKTLMRQVKDVIVSGFDKK